jgi:hypothetical protein
MSNWSKKQIIITAVFFCCVWIGVPLWIWKSLPTENEYRNNRLFDIEQTLQNQQRLVEIALVEELYSEDPSTDRIMRLEKIKEMLQGAEEF